MIDLWFWLPVMLSGMLAGVSTGVMGVYVVGMRMPFLGVCVSHAALAGAVFGALCGLHGQALLMPALLAALAAALALGLLSPDRIRMDSNILLGSLFSLSMGLSFLGIGLFPRFGRSDNEVRNLLWGSLTFCRWNDVWLLVAASAAVAAFVGVFGKEMRAILFCRTQAAAAGIRTTIVWTGFLVLTSFVLTVSFQTLGGLMIYSLMTSPAVAAFQLVRGHRATIWTTAAIGMFCGLGGFLIAAIADLPTGAVTVLLCSAVVFLATGINMLNRRSRGRKPAAYRSARPVELIARDA